MIASRRLLLKAAALGTPMALAGCASGPSVDPNDESRSLVYGFFDMKDGADVQWVVLKRYDSAQWVRTAASDGVFLHVGLPAGSWQVFSFGSPRNVYEFGMHGRNDTALRIERPGVYYMGAYKYVPVEKNWLSKSTFDMKPISQPNEKTVLVKVIKTMEADYSEYQRQIARARQRPALLA